MIRSKAVVIIALLLLFAAAYLPFASSDAVATRDTEVEYDAIDPTLRLLMVQRNLFTKRGTVSFPFSPVPELVAQPKVQVNIRFERALSETEVRELEALGVEFVHVEGKIMCIGPIYVVRVPWELLGALGSRSDVVRIESSYDPFLETYLPVSVPYIGAARVSRLHTWERVGFTGKGMLIGLPDTGVDWMHPWLRYENGTEKVWKYLTKDGVYIRGVNLTRAPRDKIGHGTPIAGILVAGRPGIDEYVGVAPHAGLVVVDIFHKEHRVSPDVALIWLGTTGVRAISISWGWPIWRFFDGSGNIDAIIDELAARGIVSANAAGNEGLGKRHARVTIPARGSIKLEIEATDFRIFRPDFTALNVLAVTTVWRTPDVDLTFTIKPPGRPPVRLTGRDNTTIVDDIEYYSWRTTSRRETAHYNLYAYYYRAPRDVPPPPGDQLPLGRWTIEIENPSDTAVTISSYVRGYDWEGFTTPTSFLAYTHRLYTLLSEPLADSMITVGAFAYTPPVHMGDLAIFSSRGPRIDGFEKPELTAPGVDVVTAASGDYYHDHRFIDPRLDKIRTRFSGTSASAPFVAGSAVLLLEANPALTSAQVKEILTKGARVDEHVLKDGKPWNPHWGYGKVDALKSFAEIYTIVSISAAGISPPHSVKARIEPVGAPLRSVEVTLAPGVVVDFAFGLHKESIRVSVDPLVPVGKDARYASAGCLIDKTPTRGTSVVLASHANLTWVWRMQWRATFSYSVAPPGEKMKGTVSLHYVTTEPGEIEPLTLSVILTEEPRHLWIDDKTKWEADFVSTLSTKEERWAALVREGVVTSPISATITYYHQLLTELSYSVALNGLPAKGQIFLYYTSFGGSAKVLLPEVPTEFWMDYGSKWSMDALSTGSTEDERWANSLGNQTGPPGVKIVALYYHQFRFTVESLYGRPRVAGYSLGKEAFDAVWYDRGQHVVCSVESVIDLGNGTRRVFVRWLGVDAPTSEFTVTLLRSYHVVAEWKTQYFLKVLSVYGRPLGIGWYDRGSVAKVSIEEAVGVRKGVRALFVRWVGVGIPGAAVEILMDSPRTLEAIFKLQYLFTIEFYDAAGVVRLRPSYVELLFEDKTLKLREYENLWVDEGVYTVRAVVWMGMDVKMVEYTITLNEPKVVKASLRVYELEVVVKDPLGLPVSGALARLRLANGTITELKSDERGVVRAGLIPIGTYEGEVSYLGLSTAFSGDASAEPTLSVVVLLSGVTVGLAVAVVIALTSASVILRRRRR